MTCIVINNEPLVRNGIETLINQTDDLILLASFGNTCEASTFMSENTVDLVFFDIQTDETKGYGFIQVIPRKTFVIFISDFFSTAIQTYKPDVIISSKSVRFQKGVDMARTYSSIVEKENSTIADDYFVI